MNYKDAENKAKVNWEICTAQESLLRYFTANLVKRNPRVTPHLRKGQEKEEYKKI